MFHLPETAKCRIGASKLSMRIHSFQTIPPYQHAEQWWLNGQSIFTAGFSQAKGATCLYWGRQLPWFYEKSQLEVRAQGFGVSSDWPDLNDLCVKTGTKLRWTLPSRPCKVSDAIVEDPSITVEVMLRYNNTMHLLQPRTSMGTLLEIQKAQNMEYWSIKTPGKAGKTALCWPLYITHHLQ